MALPSWAGAASQLPSVTEERPSLEDERSSSRSHPTPHRRLADEFSPQSEASSGALVGVAEQPVPVVRPSAARARRLASASGSAAHRRVLEELSTWREAVDAVRPGTLVQQPLSNWRPPRPLEFKRSSQASSIQRAWRRRKIALQLDSGSNADGDALLTSLQHVEGNRALDRAGVLSGAALPPPGSRSDVLVVCVSEGAELNPADPCPAAAAPADAPIPSGPPKPEIAVARAAVRRQLPTTAAGRLWPLHTELDRFDRFGTDVSQYMHFVYRLARLGAWLFLLNLSNVVINFEGNELGSAMSFFTIHTLGNAANNVLARGGHSYAVIEVCTAVMLLSFLFSARSEFESIRDRIRRGGHGGASLTAADFTVMVKNVPVHWRAEQLREHFERFGEVVHVGVSLDYRELILAMQRTQRLKDRHIDATLHLVALIKAGSPRAVLDNARRKARRALVDLDASRTRTKQLSRSRYHCTGYAFVTFNESAAASRAVERIAQRRTFSRVFGGGLVVERAPEPSDIIWENLQFSPRQQLLRQALSVAVLTLLLLVSVTLLTGVNLFQSDDYFLSKGLLEASFDFIPEEPSFFELVLLQLVQNVLIIVGYVSVFITVPLLANLVERPHTKGAREATTMLKLAFFNCGITVTSVLVMTWVGTEANSRPDGSFKRDWYPLGMSLILNTLIADIFLIQLVMDLARPQDLVRKHILARRAKTQARMNELYACSAEGLLAFRMQLLVKVLTLGFTFSFAMPALYLVLAIYGWLAQWVDRILFLRLLLPPPPTHGRLMNYVVHWVLPFAIAVHSLLAFKLFVDICKEEVDGAATAESTLVDPLSLLNGTASTNATGCEPPPLALKACTDLTWSSARVVLATTAAVVSLVVLVYWATMTKRLQQRRAFIRSKGGAPQLLTSDVSARRFQKLYRLVVQRDMAAPHLVDGEGALAARVRAVCAPAGQPLSAGAPERPCTPLAEATDASSSTASSCDADDPPGRWSPGKGAACGPAHGVPQGGKPAHVSIRVWGPPHLDVACGGTNTPMHSPAARVLPSPAVLARERTASSCKHPVLLDEHTMMYIPPLTRVILDSLYKDMCNRSVDTFLRQNTPAAFPVDAHEARPLPGIQTVLPFLFRTPSEGDQSGMLRRSPVSAAERPNRPGAYASPISALRTLPGSYRLPSMPSMPIPHRPSALLLQLDAIERALSGRKKTPFAPTAQVGEAGAAFHIEPSTPHPTGGAPSPSSAAGSAHPSSAGARMAQEAICADEDPLDGMEVAELAEAAQRLTQVAEHARHMLVRSLERAASSGALLERTSVAEGNRIGIGGG